MPPDSPAAGDILTSDDLRQLAGRLIDDSPDNQSQAAAKVGVGRSTMSRALSGAEDLPTVNARVVEYYAGLGAETVYRLVDLDVDRDA
ncbi:hypothetical protein B1759_14910 [Rubrivirga sp. SAORIC476]|uniref:hypothetical protein n=1 Tax=Rubrivirga sp. SAORIC476 TaxID=1961794 RepID=UPI000BA953DA|nr:hypothetical protein [Rubrivirga sp. SAORIC476]PAP79608.1 hypothetical protein B1759_14910 [Rubrivirga sp. SAORIC476]